MNRGVQHELVKIREKLAEGAGEAQALSAVDNVVFTGDLALLQRRVHQELMGAGATIAPLLDDPRTTDVTINGAGEVWVDRGEGMEKVATSDPQLTHEEGVRALAMRLAARCGQRLDDASPIVDGTFPSGLRLHAVLPPLSAQGTLISLRTHRSTPLSLEELVSSGSVTADLEPLLRAMVNARANVIISGSTGAGKTTVLNALLSLCAPSERLVIIEESAELRPVHPHVVHLQVRRANVQGVGEVTMSELVRAAMRMRPDRLVLGECRGVEVRDVLGALNTGHEGGWATIHANSAMDVPARLVALGALAHMSEATVAAQASAALDAVIHVKRSFHSSNSSGKMRVNDDNSQGDSGTTRNTGSTAQCREAGGADVRAVGHGVQPVCASHKTTSRLRWVAQIACLRRNGGSLISEPAFSVDQPGGRLTVFPAAYSLCERLGMEDWIARTASASRSENVVHRDDRERSARLVSKRRAGAHRRQEKENASC